MKNTISRSGKDPFSWLLPVAFGSVLALGGILWLARAASFVGHGTKVTGQIVTMGRDEGTEGITYHPVFTFSDASGIVHTQRSSVGGPFSYHQKGDTVEVLYDPANPEHASIVAPRTVWGGPSYLTVFGLSFVGFGCVLHVASRKGQFKTV